MLGALKTKSSSSITLPAVVLTWPIQSSISFPFTTSYQAYRSGLASYWGANDVIPPEEFRLQAGQHFAFIGVEPYKHLHLCLKQRHIDLEEVKDIAWPDDRWFNVFVHYSNGYGVVEVHAPDCDEATALAALRLLILYIGV